MIKLKDFRRIVLLIAITLLLQIEVLEAFIIPSSFSSKLAHNIRLNPYRRPLAPLKSTDQPLINGNIQFDEVRLILAGSNGEPDEMIGIVSIDDALEKAEELELDLVCINENADPPVCKIIDYGKYRYEVEKRKKENMKKQAKAGDLKEIKMSYHIEQHDFDVRIRQIKKFVADGDRVKVTVVFKGREMQNTKLGADLLNRVFETVSSVAVMESPPTIEWRSMLMMVGPKKKGQ